jgi:hypothetical protein
MQPRASIENYCVSKERSINGVEEQKARVTRGVYSVHHSFMRM